MLSTCDLPLDTILLSMIQLMNIITCAFRFLVFLIKLYQVELILCILLLERREQERY